MGTRTELDEVRQGLKPISLSASNGTAKAVPFHNPAAEAAPLPKPAAEAAPFQKPSAPESAPASEFSGADASIKEVVKQKYGEAALRVKSGGSSCCGATASTGCCDPITTNLYDAAQAGQIPEEALLASLGRGNPNAMAKLNPGG